MINIGEVLIACRKRKGWSQKELAEKAGVNVGSLWRYENNLTVPMLSSVEYLLEAMGYELVVRKKQ